MINSVDLVIISSPPNQHLFHLEACVQAGKHVVIEKPICGDLDTLSHIKNIAEKAQTVITVFQNRRWDSNFLALKEIIASGKLGRIVSLKSRMDRWRPIVKEGHWRSDPQQGGLLLDLGSHLVDQIYHLFGPPDSVSKVVKCQRGGGSNDYFYLGMEYEGLQVSVEAGSLVACPHYRFEVHGTEGSWVIKGEDPQEDQIKGGMSPLNPEFGIHPNTAELFIAQEDGIKRTEVAVNKGSWIEYYRQLAISITTNSPPPVSIDDALATLPILLS